MSFSPFAARGVIPHQGEQGGGVACGVAATAWPRRTPAAPASIGVDIDALERGGQQADGRELAGAAADPVPHREPGEPPFRLGDLVELRAVAGDGDGVLGEVEAGGL